MASTTQPLALARSQIAASKPNQENTTPLMVGAIPLDAVMRRQASTTQQLAPRAKHIVRSQIAQTSSIAASTTRATAARLPPAATSLHAPTPRMGSTTPALAATSLHAPTPITASTTPATAARLPLAATSLHAPTPITASTTPATAARLPPAATSLHAPTP